MSKRGEMRIAMLLLSLIITACGKAADTAAKKPDDSTRDADAKAMADMPGMGGESKPPADSVAASNKEVKFTAAQITHGGVKWGAVSMGAAAGVAIVPGEVTPNEDRTMRLGAPARGRVTSVSVRPGDRVKVGQALVALQSPEAGMAQADVAKANAEVASRRSEVQYATSARARAERLLALKAIPRQEYERALADDDHARTALEQAEAEARRARTTAAQLGAADAAPGEIVLRAPAAGTVLLRDAMPGAVLDAGASLVVVTDLSSLWLTIFAPEQLSALFKRDGRLRFTVPTWPADTFSARIDAVGAGLETTTRTLSVRAVINNSAARLKPQMFATVVVEGAIAGTAAFVPEDAVQQVEGKPCVFLATPDAGGGAHFVRREVLLGARQGGRVAVLHGLSAGDVIVTSGAFAVKAEMQKGTMQKMEM